MKRPLASELCMGVPSVYPIKAGKMERKVSKLVEGTHVSMWTPLFPGGTYKAK